MIPHMWSIALKKPCSYDPGCSSLATQHDYNYPCLARAGRPFPNQPCRYKSILLTQLRSSSISQKITSFSPFFSFLSDRSFLLSKCRSPPFPLQSWLKFKEGRTVLLAVTVVVALPRCRRRSTSPAVQAKISWKNKCNSLQSPCPYKLHDEATLLRPFSDIAAEAPKASLSLSICPSPWLSAWLSPLQASASAVATFDIPSSLPIDHSILIAHSLPINSSPTSLSCPLISIFPIDFGPNCGETVQLLALLSDSHVLCCFINNIFKKPCNNLLIPSILTNHRQQPPNDGI